MDCNSPASSYGFLKNKMETKMRVRPFRPKPTVEVKPSRPKTVLLTPEEEEELVDYIVELQKIVFRLTINDVIVVANQLAEKYNKKLLFRSNVITAERLWVLDLIKRHPKIILRIPDNNSKPGGFNMAELDYFYKTLIDVYDVKKIPPDRIYTTDNIKIFFDENTTHIINKAVGKENAFSNFTFKICFSADGHYIPSMMVFPQNQRTDLNNKGARTTLPSNVPQTNELFLQWFRRFIFLSGAKKEQQVLLLFDGQPMYTKNIEIVKNTRDNGINMISFPPFTSNKLQPVDEVFINDLSKSYEKVVKTWSQLNPKIKLTERHVGDLLDKTFSDEGAAIAAIEAFKRCGIYPIHTNLFTESDFIPEETKVTTYKEKTPPPTNTKYETYSSNRYNFDLYYDPIPGCSFWPDYV